MENPSRIKVAIADDHQVVIDGICAMLENSQEIEMVGSAYDGKSAIDVVRILKPQVLLMDINMPDMDGIEATKIISRQHPDVKILMLSMLKEQSMVRKALDYGALGYVLKNEGKENLIEAIQCVANDKQYLSDGISLESQIAYPQDGTPRISRREKQVLELIVNEYTAKEIATELFISVNTVDAHRKNLLMKLDVRNTAGLVRTAIEHHLLG